jgi:malonate transporter
VAVGWLAARTAFISATAVPELTRLLFYVFGPALLFRAMSRVDLTQLDWRPVVAYYGVGLALMGLIMWRHRGSGQGAVLGIASVFSNAVMIGLPLVTLALGPAALVTILTIIATQALVLLTVATLAIETERAPQATNGGGRRGAALVAAARSALLHPVPIPILLGLLYASTGLGLPELVDRPLQWLGGVFGPFALVLLGASLFHQSVRGRAPLALGVAATKLVLCPLLVLAVGWLVGLRGLPLGVLTLTAALPVGANAFVFSQRYSVARDVVTAAMAWSTAASAVTLSLWLALLRGLGLLDVA